MAQTDSAFAGSIPALYERYFVPLLFQPYAEDMAERLKDFTGTDLLETAAGTGAVTRTLERALPRMRIVATDLNQTMLDNAASNTSAPNVTWRQADAMNLPFAE